jgi:dihydrofolate synthase/folylpolyglutamate synthase
MSLDRIRRLLADLGDPQERIAPVIHVAGTNGKGSTVAYLRAIAEAAGLRAHVYTSPHLVRFNERIRLAGALIDDDALGAILEEVERVNAGAPITFFEITTVAAFVAFARAPADLTLLEVGMGGRLDATNLVRQPLASVITPVSFDHMDYLGDTLGAIAGEKAGILKPGVPAAVAAQPVEADAAIARRAREIGAPLFRHGREWRVTPHGSGFAYAGVRRLELPMPALAGPHQIANAATAIAAIDLLPGRIAIDAEAIGRGLQQVEWPARLQRLTRGPLVASLEKATELWLDGAHNDDGARVVADWVRSLGNGATIDLVVALRSTKRAAGFFAALAPVTRRLVACGNAADHLATPPEALALAARAAGIADVATAPDVGAAIRRLADRSDPPLRVLICGSLYFAGAVLAENG